jgi:hypothetical protein
VDDWQLKLANHLTQGDVSALPQMLILIGALIGCSLFALVQFLTMLGTRWGDKNPAPKSLVLSILIHVVVILAWSTAIAIRPLSAVMALPSNSPAAIPIREIIDNEPEDQFEPGETPVWKRLNDLPDVEVNRQKREAEEPKEMPEAPLQPSDAPNMDPTELADLSVRPTEAALPHQDRSPAEIIVKAPPMSVMEVPDDPVAEAREEAGTGTPARSTSRKTPTPDLNEDFPQTRGSETAAVPRRPDDLAMSIPLERGGPNGDNPVPDGVQSATIRKGAAPTPSSAPDGDFVPDGRTDAEGAPTRSRLKTLDRAKTRPLTEADGDSPLPDRIPGEGRPAINLHASRLPRPSVSGVRDQTDLTPTPSLAPAPAAGPNLPNRSPATYKLRKLQQRRGTALRNGGSLESEKAVENSLKWLAKVQQPEGNWSSHQYGGGAAQKDPHGHDRKDGGKFADSGVTGLALLAFMGAGYTANDGEYAEHVDRGLKWLMLQQRSDGYLGGTATYYDQMYCHAIATFALAEACGMQDDAERSPELLRAVRLGVDFIVHRQSADGGWRYKKGDYGDMSMFGWQLMALKSADIAGVKVTPEVWNLMIAFLKKRSLGENSGLAAYRLEEAIPTPAMTAEALFCKQMIGIRRTNPACQEAVAYLRKHLPKITAYDEYYWYYGTLAMFQYGDEAWNEWNNAQRDLLIRLQQTSGPNAGSWDPKGKWAGIGGRIYSTALSTLILEVYYRYLPLYQSTQE